jgi:hypothetical protein
MRQSIKFLSVKADGMYSYQKRDEMGEGDITYHGTLSDFTGQIV